MKAQLQAKERIQYESNHQEEDDQAYEIQTKSNAKKRYDTEDDYLESQ
jgi:hypothetical protein